MLAEHAGGAVILLAQPPRRQADHPHVPVPTAHDQRLFPDEVMPRCLRLRSLDQPLLGGAALGVERVQLLGQPVRLGGVLRHHQAHALARVVQTARRVQPRPQPVAQHIAVHGVRVAAHPQQGAHALPFPSGDRLEPQRHQNPVFVLQRHDVRHGGQGRQVQILPARLRPQQRLRQLEGHPRSAQAAEGIVPQQRVERRVGGAGLQPQAVMVGHDHAHAQPLGQTHLLVVGDAQVHRDQHAIVFGQLLHRRQVQAVALLPQRRMGIGPEAEAAQGLRHQRAGADAVHVVIAVDQHGQPLPARIRENRQRLRHAVHAQGVVQPVQRGVQERAGLRRVGDAARVQKPRRYPLIGAKRGRGAPVQRARLTWNETKQCGASLHGDSQSEGIRPSFPRDTPARC